MESRSLLMTTGFPDSDGSPASTNDIIEALWSRTQAYNKVKLSSLWKPYGTELYPSSDLLVDVLEDAGAATGRFPAGFGATLWNSPNFNTQGMVVTPLDPQNISAGARNQAPARTFTGGCYDFEFTINDNKLSFMAGAFSGWDCQVYVSDDNDVMRKLKPRPLIYTGPNTPLFRSIVFATRRTRRVRYVGAFDAFYQLLHSPDAVIRKTEDRPLVVSISDSFRDASGMKNNGSAESYHTAAINEWYVERTGWALQRMGIGGTGWFNNASGTASNNDGPDGATPFFSDKNVNKIKAIGKNKIRIIDINGTINDGELSGGKAGMKARVIQGLNKISSWDSGIRFVIWGPEPYNNSWTNPVHAANREALMEVAAERSDVIGFIDCSNPSSPFYSGLGYETAPVVGSSQSVLTGADTIHYNYLGGQHYAKLGLDIMANFEIEKERPLAA